METLPSTEHAASPGVPPPASGSVTHSKEIRFEDADPKNPLTREEMLWVDATPDADYPLRILRAYLRNTTLRTISEPPLLGEIMNKAQDERAVILQDAIDRLTASPNTEISNAAQKSND